MSDSGERVVVFMFWFLFMSSFLTDIKVNKDEDLKTFKNVC